MVTSPTEELRIELTASAKELPGIQVTAANPGPSTTVLSQTDLNRWSHHVL